MQISRNVTERPSNALNASNSSGSKWGEVLAAVSATQAMSALLVDRKPELQTYVVDARLFQQPVLGL